MSRHRDIRNLNIRDELDDSAISDGGEEDMTDEQYAQMYDGLGKVRAVLGDEDVSGLSDKDIKDALWEYFFDQEKTILWALDEQQKRHLARERKEPYSEKQLPPVPQEDDETPSNAEYYHPEEFNFQDSNNVVERSRVPLIVQAQQQGYGKSMDGSDPGTPRIVRPALSTITEITERTEATPHWSSPLQLINSNTSRRASSSFTSSYGDVIEHRQHSIHNIGPTDPNLIPVSPSGSALNRLSLFEPAPSPRPSESRSTESPHLPSEPVPPSEELPEIPDYSSKSSKQAPLPIPPPKKSKLSLLASSRAGSITSRSESSRSSGIALTGSIKTFPALRPSARSALPSSLATPSLTPSRPGENEEYYGPTSTAPPSSTSSHVRRAIQTAMNLEAIDQEVASPHSEKLPEEETPAHPPVHHYKEVQTFRPPSKLALLALAKTSVAKTSAAKGPKLPKPVTEYLTPTANGPTATTAITTSYQSLYSLTDPTRSPVIPEQYVVPLGAKPLELKSSKLAMKIRKANEKHKVTTFPDDEVITPPVSPMFYSNSSAHIRASPSTFACLLIDDHLITSEGKGKDKSTGRKEKEKVRDKTDQMSATSKISVATEEIYKNRSRRQKTDRLRVPDFSPPVGFTFDSPSPDDVVFNARRGTSLGQQKDPPPSTSTPRKPLSSK